MNRTRGQDAGRTPSSGPAPIGTHARRRRTTDGGRMEAPGQGEGARRAAAAPHDPHPRSPRPPRASGLTCPRPRACAPAPAIPAGDVATTAPGAHSQPFSGPSTAPSTCGSRPFPKRVLAVSPQGPP